MRKYVAENGETVDAVVFTGTNIGEIKRFVAHRTPFYKCVLFNGKVTLLNVEREEELVVPTNYMLIESKGEYRCFSMMDFTTLFKPFR